MQKFFLSIGLIAISTLFSQNAAMAEDNIESPEFEVTLSENAVELRRYEPMIAAEVRVVAEDMDNAGSLGFMPLANYIFGRNRPGEKVEMTAPVTMAPVMQRDSLRGGEGEKIAMTAPVTTVPDDEGTYAVRFMMPSKWTMETLPAPMDDRVALVQVPQRFVVVSGFIGPKEEASIDVAEQAISDFVVSNGLSPIGEFTLAGYSAPNVPDAQKKWEVHLLVETPG